MTPQILFEDDALVVLDKPAGITVNKADTTKGEVTVQDFIEETYPSLFTDKTTDFGNRGGIVHRLDKETSGVLIVAKSQAAFAAIQAQFKLRTVKKTYIALAHGKITIAGEVRVPVGRLPWNRKQFGIVAGGRESITKYSVLGSYLLQNAKLPEPLTLLELYPETGRTHQIRVHLKHINHPIFADFLYAGRKTSRDDRKILARVFLHAASISFSHPVSGERMLFSSRLPDELQAVLDNLGKVHA
jgi:23S rRNA pseudouridine1911/1915/1917 synthase